MSVRCWCVIALLSNGPPVRCLLGISLACGFGPSPLNAAEDHKVISAVLHNIILSPPLAAFASRLVVDYCASEEMGWLVLRMST